MIKSLQLIYLFMRVCVCVCVRVRVCVCVFQGMIKHFADEALTRIFEYVYATCILLVRNFRLLTVYVIYKLNLNSVIKVWAEYFHSNLRTYRKAHPFKRQWQYLKLKPREVAAIQSKQSRRGKFTRVL
jgi:hypothetical protein